MSSSKMWGIVLHLVGSKMRRWSVVLHQWLLLCYRWPLIIDSGQQAATFLRYRDTNYLNVCNPRHMAREAIRMALIGAIR